jgi:hypothetical protein
VDSEAAVTLILFLSVHGHGDDPHTHHDATYVAPLTVSEIVMVTASAAS